jgi:hypothetical protein
LSWIERAGNTATLRFAERTAAGWTAPVQVASGDDWFISYADPPSVLRMSTGALVAQWTRQLDPRLEAMDLLLSYSTDNGKSWSRPFTPHHDGTRTQHAFASLFELPGRQLGVLWLDGRNSFFDERDPDSGAMGLRYAAFDAAWKQTADVAVDKRVCECCPTTVAATSDGMLTAFRDRSDTEVRDIWVSRFESGQWTAPTIVHADNWETPACPINGPALSARGRQVAVTWFTAKGEQGQAYAAFSPDAGRSWGAPIRLDDASSLGRVDVELLEDGSAVAMWLEFADGRTELRTRRVGPSGTRSPAVTVSGVGEGRTSGYPRLGRHGNTLVFAWTESLAPNDDDSPLRVRTAVAALPGN